MACMMRVLRMLSFCHFDTGCFMRAPMSLQRNNQLAQFEGYGTNERSSIAAITKDHRDT